MIGFRAAVLAVVAGGLVALTTPATAAKYYKWVDDKGVTHYGEKVPEGAQASPVKVNDTTSSDAEDEIKRLEERRATASGEKKKAADAASAAAAAAPSKDEKERRQKLCNQHRQNMSTLKSPGRIMTKDDKGNPRYLTDEERAEQARITENEVKRCQEMGVGESTAPAAP